MRGDTDDVRGSLVNGLHATHGDLMNVQGTLVGCATCWRIVGFVCGEVTFAGINACAPNLEITALAQYYWDMARRAGDSTPDVERLVGEFRTALRGQGRGLAQDGGRHATDE